MGEFFTNNKILLQVELFDERKREVAAVSTIKDMGKSVDDVSEEVVDALTRDYSGLMKVINKKDNVKGNNA